MSDFLKTRVDPELEYAIVVTAYPANQTVDYRVRPASGEELIPARSESLKPFVIVDYGVDGRIIGVTLHGRPAKVSMDQGFGVELLDALLQDFRGMKVGALEDGTGRPGEPETWRELTHAEIVEARDELRPAIDWLRTLWPAA